jgi:hypothetical protein
LKRSDKRSSAGRGSSGTSAPANGSTRIASDGDLARLIRTSHLLDPVARRHWLSVLPYLTARDRARLGAILEAEDRIPKA